MSVPVQHEGDYLIPHTQGQSVVDHIPKLGKQEPTDRHRSLLPELGGQPGLTYFQCPMEYVHASTLEGWREVPVFNGLSSYA